jgi:hypothetical protein
MRLLILFIAVVLAVPLGAMPSWWRQRVHPCLGPMIYVGPEGYYLKRRLKTGSRQEGSLYGLRMLHERICLTRFYWGVETHWARGRLEGHDTTHMTSRSNMTDADVEVRVGYTFRIERWLEFLFTPLIGAGYFSECNDFEPPSRIIARFRTYFTYIPVGFASRFYLTSQLSVGVDFRARFTQDGRILVDDPNLGSVVLHYEHCIHYTLDVPVRYNFCGRFRNLELMAALFWRRRHYGPHIGVDFDSYDTRVRIAGARVMMGYRF